MGLPERRGVMERYTGKSQGEFVRDLNDLKDPKDIKDSGHSCPLGPLGLFGPFFFYPTTRFTSVFASNRAPGSTWLISARVARSTVEG